MANLGRLQKVQLRTVWENEAGQFTPSLAKEENIQLLGQTIGIELQVEAKEKAVGPFKADILCKSTVEEEHWVLIENQLERTDHTHLGQLMTYAAGLDAVTIIWIAERFTEEHRAALDWLNQITGEEINFFGLEVELWRIGNSAIAPKFNIISQPNDWSKSVTASAKKIIQGNYSGTAILRHEFWSTLTDRLAEKNSPVRPHKATYKSSQGFSLGRSQFGMFAFINTQKKYLQVRVSCSGPDAFAHFSLLQQDKEHIEKEVGQELMWTGSPDTPVCRIRAWLHNIDPQDRSQWPRCMEWMANTLEAFHKTFSPRIAELDASQFSDVQVEDDNGDDA